jgi:hypothetical protein
MHFLVPNNPWTPRSFVLPVAVDPTGRNGPTKGQARGPGWRAAGRNRYVPSYVLPDSPEQRIAEAAGNLRSAGAVTGWGALRLRKAWYLDGLGRDGRTPRPVQLAMGPGNGRRERDGVCFRYDRLEPVTWVRGIPCLPVRRALFDEVRSHRRLFDATVAVDMALLAGLVTLESMHTYVERRPGWNGVPLVRKALSLADPYSGSPPEVRVRLFWQVVMSMPRPLVNVGVFDRSGRLAGYPDLLDVTAGLVIEYDGVDHLPEEQRSKDVDREGAFRDLGLEVIHVVSRDMRHPKVLRHRLERARDRARFLPEGSRRWILDPSRPRYCPPSCSCRLEQLGGQ